MSPEDYEFVQSKFLSLRGQSEQDQQRALEALAPPLRAEIESLLASERECGDFLRPREGEFEDEVDPLAEPAMDEDTSTHAYEMPSSVPEVLGRYRLLQKIGEGGHGSVYMAEQTEPVRRKVAVKLIKPGMDSKQVLARFHAEQQALAMMDHSSIAKVFDAGVTEAGTPYFVMELVKGVPIHQFCDRTNANLRERLQLFLQVCDAVHHAHRKGIIHRDIKPSNVLVTMGEDEPIAKVIDFGIAKALDQRLTAQTLYTDYGQMIGTLEYMSPEQAEMSAVEIDTRSDVYSLGVLLYQLLTGETPISREQLLKNGVFEIPRLLRETEPRTPSDRITSRQQQLARVDRASRREGLSSLPSGDLDWIALKALAKDRRRRYDSVLDLARDVRRFLEGEPVEAHPPTLAYRTSKTLRKHWVSLAMVTILAVGALLGLCGLGWGLMQARDALAVAEQERHAAVRAQQEADASRVELAETVYSELIDSAWRAAREQRNSRARDLLERCPPALRGWEWSFVGSRQQQNDAITGLSAAIQQLDIQGRRVACLLQSGEVEIWDLASGQRQQSLKFPRRANVVRWSTDGALLLVGSSDGSILVVHPENGRTLSTYDLRQGGIYDICVTPADSVVGVCCGSGRVERLRLQTETSQLAADQDWQVTTRLSAVVFDTAGVGLLGAGFDGQLYEMQPGDAPAGQPISPSSLLGLAVASNGERVALTGTAVVGWSPGDEPNVRIELPSGARATAVGKKGWIAAGGGDGSLLTKELTGDAPPIRLGSFGSAINALRWVPWRQQYLVALSDRRVLWVDAAPAPSDQDTAVATATAGIVLDKEAQLLTFDSAGDVNRIDMETGRSLEQRKVHDRAVWSVATDRDLQLLVSVGDDQTVKAWDLPALTERFSAPLVWGVRDVVVDPAGQWIAAAPPPDGEGGPREGTIAIRDPETGEALHLLEGHENWVLKMAVTPDGKLLASSGEFPNARLWNTDTGKQVRRFDYDQHGAAPQAAIDPRGEMLYLGHRDGWVTAWDLRDGRPRGEWAAFGDEVSGLAATRDGRLLAISASSPELRVYDFARRRELARLDLGMGFLLRMQLADDDQRLSVMGGDRQLRQLPVAALSEEVAGGAPSGT